ncbi:hypothetical protein BBA70_01625 [New Jersey aster yellows phytoplasma]|uniref:Uncharacterized protein n=1 Tax=New Jersey aster yellows phytoplasma TaxID=270520 RepID=A0ABX4K0H7_9MOLU|nr:hypothetical protein BBA70_01625 [New Jersey aster yellows phytoplasma]
MWNLINTWLTKLNNWFTNISNHFFNHQNKWLNLALLIIILLFLPHLLCLNNKFPFDKAKHNQFL